MQKSTAHIINIVKSGGSVVIEKKSVEHLKDIAKAAAKSGAKVTIADAQNLFTDHILEIAKIGRGNIFFDLTE